MSVIAQHIASDWPLIEPFERSEEKTLDDLKDGESEYDVCQEFVHVVEWDGEPPNIVKLNHEEIKLLKSDPLGYRKNYRDSYRNKCFLWVLTESSLVIAREKIRNTKRTHDPDFICHTNLTNAGNAYVGGEVLFGDDGVLYINYFSDRYGGRGTPPELWGATKLVFTKLGYVDIIDFLELQLLL